MRTKENVSKFLINVEKNKVLNEVTRNNAYFSHNTDSLKEINLNIFIIYASNFSSKSS